MTALKRYLPFLGWFPLTADRMRADVLAGTTVAMVLVPQSMAYAQLAGLPAYYGLYAAFLPVLVGALWGSSHQLSTGPVAIVSLLTGYTLAKFAAPGSEQFVTLAIALAFLVGAMQLAMGVFRLGAIVSFVSHPVIAGFTNAAAIIIALSQLNKLLAVPVARGEYFLLDIWNMLQQVGEAHVPTLVMGLSALLAMVAMRRYAPRLPGALIVVVLAVAVSWATGFERSATAPPEAFRDAEIGGVISTIAGLDGRIRALHDELDAKANEVKRLERERPDLHPRRLMLQYDTDVLRLELRTIEREHRLRMRELRRFVFERVEQDGRPALYLEGAVPPGARSDGERWRVARIADGAIHLAGGGEVVGHIPRGVPELALPKLDWNTMLMLLSTAFVITLVGFMEAISIAKAMATKTRQRIDPNQELVGQGLANLAGSLCHAFPVSGSFSRSAVNLAAGAATGMSSVTAGLIVLATLLVLTPLLYHLPQAVLAAVIMIAVLNLLNLGAIKHAWQAHRHDGAAAIVTFLATLAFAPHLDNGILAGAGLAIVLYLLRTMRPRIAVLGRHPDGTLRDARLHGLQTSEHIIVIRFDGSLYFANVPYFEDAVLAEAARTPNAKYILLVADGINEMDASGEELIRHLVQRLRENGITVVFSGLKMQILRVMENTGLYGVVGAQNLFRTEDAALEAIYQWIRDPSFDVKICPLNPPASATADETPAGRAIAAAERSPGGPGARPDS